jgi:hypothetical protein
MSHMAVMAHLEDGEFMNFLLDVVTGRIDLEALADNANLAPSTLGLVHKTRHAISWRARDAAHGMAWSRERRLTTIRELFDALPPTVRQQA